MEKLCSGGLASSMKDVGKTVKSFPTKHVFTTLLLMLLCMFMPQKGWAEIITTTYDFAASAQQNNTTTTFGSNTITINRIQCNYFTQLGNVSNPERFAAQGADKFSVRKSSGTNPTYGLQNTNSGGRLFVISNLYSGDKVTFNASATLAVQNGNAEGSNNDYTIKAKGDLAVQVPQNGWIYSITISHDDVGAYSYDPAVEVYDLYNVTGSYGTSDAGFNLNSRPALYLTNLQGGLALNNRIAISQSSQGTSQWVFNDHGLKAQWSWHNLSICNLKEGDRVVILYTGQATFSSAGQSGGYNGCAAYKDVENDGEFNGQDANISNGMTLEAKYTGYDNNLNTNTYTTYAYTVTEDGHLDIGLSDGSRILKVTIYGDHQAQMLDRYNGSATTGHTAYFSSTGQLMAKEHVVPGGLEVQIGNTEESQHAIVVSSDEGPVSFIYDQSHFKMARQASYGEFNVMTALPATGTYYKFIPEVSGSMTVRLKASSVNYRDYYNHQGNEAIDQNGTPNEVTNSVQCPYYLMRANGTQPEVISQQTKGNGATFSFANKRVEAGQVYYIYGWWDSTSDAFNINSHACGVAELIDVTFIPDNMVTPLAKWVASGTTSDDNLADVTGFSSSDVRVKKKSANITFCEPFIEGNKLKIKNITFANGANPGGTILIKLGDPNNDANPVFAYTIAYDASFNMPEGAARSEGHTWDFSTNPLNGLKWSNKNAEAVVTDFGKEAGPGLLYDEMHETNPDGSAHSDWTKTWRVINNQGVGTHDLMFQNKYDMEGDNADMMWDTEGLIIQTSSNQSAINNEFGNVVDHSKFGTQNDPDRYVAILPGGSFTIPALKAGDRVEIYMGSGDGSGDDACKLNITGALDAIGQTISSSDIYNAGGSVWKYNAGNESRYRGAYQFISTGGDMKFTMNGGSMIKLYSIKIYTGVKTGSNDATKYNYDLTYNGDEYIGKNNAWWHFNDNNTVTPARSAYTMHYRGKGERLRTPTVLYNSGNINTDADHLMYAEIGENNAPYILFKSEKEQYGMFRMRIDDLELNNKYVADYGLQNITVGYYEKKNYPYTWDFTDLLGYVNTSTRIQKERDKIAAYAPKTQNGNHDIEFMNNTVGEDVKSVEQWKYYDQDGDIPAGYGLQVRNEPFNGGVMWYNGQLYAGEGFFSEASFLGIKVPEFIDDKGDIQPDVTEAHNGGVRVCDEGLCLTGGNWTITLPQVGTMAAVYVRAKQVGSEPIYAAVGDVKDNSSFTYEGTATDGSGDKIYAINGTGGDMKLMFNNLIIKKIAISQDFKTVNKLGYATESRNVEIDPELMGYMTGTGLKAYTVTNVTYGDKPGDKASVTLTQIPAENLMGEANDGDHRGYIIYNTDATKTVNILQNGNETGFHLFVPDMHDKNGASGSKKSNLDVEGGKNHLRSCYQGGTIVQTEKIGGVEYTNYLLNYKYTSADGKQHEGPEAFYRASKSASLKSNKAYLQLETAKVKPTEANQNGAKFAIIFVDEEQGTETTSLDGVKSVEMLGDNAIYTLSGVKVSKPEKGGIYVKNGKKFIAK